MECEYIPGQATVLFRVTRTCLRVLKHRDVRLLVGNCIRQITSCVILTWEVT